MKTLSPTDYVIYDRANDRVLLWDIDDDMVIYGDKNEADEDCLGNEEVIPCTELPAHHQEKLIIQINRD